MLRFQVDSIRMRTSGHWRRQWLTEMIYRRCAQDNVCYVPCQHNVECRFMNFKTITINYQWRQALTQWRNVTMKTNHSVSIPVDKPSAATRFHKSISIKFEFSRKKPIFFTFDIRINNSWHLFIRWQKRWQCFQCSGTPRMAVGEMLSEMVKGKWWKQNDEDHHRRMEQNGETEWKISNIKCSLIFEF